MQTKIIRLDPQNFSIDQMQEAIELIRKDEIVAFPTETVYGLGGSAFSEIAVKKIYEAKGRPSDNPMIVHISNFEMLSDIVKEVPKNVRNLCNELWPGPLTILFEKSEKIPDIVTAGLNTVAVRMPSHPIAFALLNALNIPIAAPSANLSSRPSPTKATHVFNDLHGKIPLIIDGGACKVGVESTVIEIHQDHSIILRPGGVSLEQLRKYFPEIKVYNTNKQETSHNFKPATPGLKYKHYSPKADVILIEGSKEYIQEQLNLQFIKYRPIKNIIGILHTHKNIQIPEELLKDPKCKIISLGIGSDENQAISDTIQKNINSDKIAEELFDTLRRVDDQKIDLIIVEGISEKEKGLAVMNRLRKASSKIIKE